jgi:all-trans-retinol dehydrogenase (NAD+)
LRRELLSTNVKTTLVCPWIIDTGMFAGVGNLFMPYLKAEYTADMIVEAVRYEQELLIMPRLLYLLPLVRLMPIKITDMIGVLTGTTSAMSHFQGRGEKWLFGKE